MNNQTATVRISQTSASTDNTSVRVEVSAGTSISEPFTLAWYSTLTLPKTSKHKSHIERKLRKMGR